MPHRTDTWKGLAVYRVEQPNHNWFRIPLFCIFLTEFFKSSIRVRTDVVAVNGSQSVSNRNSLDALTMFDRRSVSFVLRKRRERESHTTSADDAASLGCVRRRWKVHTLLPCAVMYSSRRCTYVWNCIRFYAPSGCVPLYRIVRARVQTDAVARQSVTADAIAVLATVLAASTTTGGRPAGGRCGHG